MFPSSLLSLDTPFSAVWLARGPPRAAASRGSRAVSGALPRSARGALRPVPRTRRLGGVSKRASVFTAETVLPAGCTKLLPSSSTGTDIQFISHQTLGCLFQCHGSNVPICFVGRWRPRNTRAFCCQNLLRIRNCLG